MTPSESLKQRSNSVDALDSGRRLYAPADLVDTAATSSGFDMSLMPTNRQFLEPAVESYEYPATYQAAEPLTKPHTITALLCVLAAVLYAVYVKNPDDSVANIKIGLGAVVGVGLVFATEYFRDTLLIRPHPAFWRLVNGAGFFYMLLCAFAMCQNIQDLRYYVTHLDSSLTGLPLPERSYGDNCDFSYENLRGSVDEFVIAHSLGWWGKAVMLRDPWLAWALSFLFEILEYTFTHILPNFNECWWDHWFLDFFGCNAIGIVLGHWTLKWLNSREYNWNGIRETATVSGKLRRGLLQFTPVAWVRYRWEVFSNFWRFCAVLISISMLLLVEINAFFLKSLLWVPPSSMLNVYRLSIWWLLGCVGFRDWYHFITDKHCKRLGSSAWICLAICSLETLIIIKFGQAEWGHIVWPASVTVSWCIAIGIALGGCAYWFLIELPHRRKLKL